MGTISPKDYYRLSVPEVLQQLHTNEEGLSAQESAARATHYGPNTIAAHRHDVLVHMYARQYKHWLVLLLLAGSALAYGLDDVPAAVVLLFLALLHTAISFAQGIRAARSMASFAQLVPAEASVVRHGNLTSCATVNLVPGDIVYVEAGMTIPADLRLIDEEALRIDDAVLVGEGAPYRKVTHALSGNLPLHARNNVAFMGTTVTAGTGLGVVTATGGQTELGRTANLAQHAPNNRSPLQQELHTTTVRLTLATIAVCVALIPIALLAGTGMQAALLFALCIAVAGIPHGIGIALNAIYSQGVRKLAQTQALCKDHAAVEQLGSTHTLFTDATGVLTKNQLRAKHLFVASGTYSMADKNSGSQGAILDNDGKPLTKAAAAKLELFFAAAALTATLPGSDASDRALIGLAAKAGYDAVALGTAHPVLKALPFDASRGLASSVRRFGAKNQRYVFTKGTPEAVLAHTISIWDDGSVRRMMPKERRAILEAQAQHTNQALQCIGIAYRILPPKTKVDTLTTETAEQELVWLGMVALEDPLREQVPNAMEAARAAGIRVSVVTNRTEPTLRAIAERTSSTKGPGDVLAISGEELQHLSDAQLYHATQQGGTLFSGMAAADKLRLVGLMHRHGKSVAITGSGMGDIPALRRADIGVAMGSAGAAMTRQAADVVLQDNSFTTLIHAIHESRTIAQNIRKALLAYLTGHAAVAAALLASFVAATLFRVPIALSVMHLLAISLIAGVIPVVALGRDKAEGKLMQHHPRSPKDRIFTRKTTLDVVWCGALIGGFAFANYLLFFGRYDIPASNVPADSLLHMKAMTLTCLTIALCQLANILQRRTTAGICSRYQLHNRRLWMAIGLSLAGITALIYVPTIASFFSAAPLSATDWLFALGAAVLFVGIREFGRHDRHHKRKAVVALHRQHRLRTAARQPR